MKKKRLVRLGVAAAQERRHTTVTAGYPRDPLPGEVSRRLATCTALAVGALLLCSDSAHGHRMGPAHFSAATWAAAPSFPIDLVAAPAIADPARGVGPTLPARNSECASEVTFDTMRRAARTRRGGRYGP